MADRNSAEIFGVIFKRLASDPTDQHKQWALDFWSFGRCYDFSWDQMHCDSALKILGLARDGVDPKYPDDAMTFYGPNGDE